MKGHLAQGPRISRVDLRAASRELAYEYIMYSTIAIAVYIYRCTPHFTTCRACVFTAFDCSNTYIVGINEHVRRLVYFRRQLCIFWYCFLSIHLEILPSFVFICDGWWHAKSSDALEKLLTSSFRQLLIDCYGSWVAILQSEGNTEVVFAKAEANLTLWLTAMSSACRNNNSRMTTQIAFRDLRYFIWMAAMKVEEFSSGRA